MKDPGYPGFLTSWDGSICENTSSGYSIPYLLTPETKQMELYGGLACGLTLVTTPVRMCNTQLTYLIIQGPGTYTKFLGRVFLHP